MFIRCVLSFLIGVLSLEAKIYLCMPFCYEYDILTIHLEELYDYVDHIVISESCETFRGNPKSYNFENNRERYKKYLDKIIYVKVGTVKTANAMDRDHWQKEHLFKGLRGAHDDDIIIFADCDEILDHRAVQKLPEIMSSRSIVAFKQRIYFFFLNYRVYYNDWYGPTATTLGYLKRNHMSLQNMRDHRNDPSKQLDYYGGWHFSSMGGFETAYYKATNWGHWDSKENPHVNSISRWKEIGYMTLPGAHTVEIDDTYPKYVREHIDALVQKGLIFVDYQTSIQPALDIYEENK